METPRSSQHDDQLYDTAASSPSPSPEMFSFPGTPIEADDGESSSEFEFGSCVTPDSPMMNNNNTNLSTIISIGDNIINNSTTSRMIITRSASPADQFFLNGRLLPHDFPVVSSTSSSRTSFSGRENAWRPTERDPASSNNINTTTTTTTTSNNAINLSRGTSVGSSISCKDSSLMSSRSNSNNSRGGGGSTCSSTCSSSARTSSGEVSAERRPLPAAFHQKRMRGAGGISRNVSLPLGRHHRDPQFGRSSSRRWQFITPAPVLGPSASLRSRDETARYVGPTTSPSSSSSYSNSNNNNNKNKKTKKREERNINNNNNNNNNNEGLLQRILRSFVATCKACHAMEGQENEFDLDEGNGSVVMGN